MEEFQKKFIEEATDLINDLEDALLQIESNPDDKELIEKIFRVMHSLKGGGSMFGFEKISEFTHNLENVYDLIRNDKLKISKELLNITLSSVDLIKMLLNKDEEDNPDIIDEYKDLSERVLQITKNIPEDNEDTDNEDFLLADEPEKISNEKTYHIFFKPDSEIFDNGTNPLFLIDELSDLGELLVMPHFDEIPLLDDFIHSKCYLFWDIILVCEHNKENIQDVFIFVEDECTLEITEISQLNLLFDLQFLAWLEDSQSKYKRYNIKEIQSFINKTDKKNEIKKDVKRPVKSKRIDAKDNVIASVRVSAEKIDHLMNLVSELVTTQASLSLFAENNKMHELVVISENVENLTRQLRDIAFSISLIPIETMLTRFHRLVRDLSSEFGKEIVFNVEGAETELDKTLIQSLTEPLMHILRNSIDHGIEPAMERVEKGKTTQGRINFKAFYSGANVHIVIQDDGKGIDPQMIKEKAISKGLINPDLTFTDKELLNMIFLPGLSTAQTITDVSGRGVGMDVVKRRISEVRGEVELESIIDVGTTITIKLPLTLSIIDGLLVKIDNTHFVVPLSVVDKIYEATHEMLADSFNNIIVLDEQQVPFYYLREEFEINTTPPQQMQLIVVKYEDMRIGLAVDLVIGEYQAVLKPLGKHYRSHEIISGATILGDGTIALVLDTNKIIKQFSKQQKEEV